MGRLLSEALIGATAYDRIAGYFSSSILEVAGEALEQMADGAPVRVVCNSSLDALDVLTAKAAKQRTVQEWCASLPADIGAPLKARLQRLYSLLGSGRLRVKVLPDERLGLVHGKAGVISRADGTKLAFLGSTNETKAGWALNYELVWSDDSPDAIDWTEEEFNALWTDPWAVDLADAVIADVGRLAKRTVMPGVETWRGEAAEIAAPVVELPVYRRDNGLWAHQKYFIKLAFDAHKRGGARFVLADEVGLGKTVSMALAAKLMTLLGGGRVLILAPKTLASQWQDELWELLSMPSAIWTGRAWIDENDVEHPAQGTHDLANCPRRVGIVSSGLVTQSEEAAHVLLSGSYECVVLDEAHRARRRNLGPTHRREAADANNLLRFIDALSSRTRSMLLGTATPVQLDPIEAWDLLNALGQGSTAVLGSKFSCWRTRPRDGLDLVTGRAALPSSLTEAWEWMRDPLPPADEGREFDLTRKALRLSDVDTWAAADLTGLRPADQQRLDKASRRFFADHHPFIRHIVRRSRDFLENTIDPSTGEPYLRRIEVRLFGEADDEALTLPPFLRDAYSAAEDFCREVGHRPGLNSGFLKTMLLRRMGSSIEAGRRTAVRLLGEHLEVEDDDADDATNATVLGASQSGLYPLLPAERRHVERLVGLLAGTSDDDPKARAVERILIGGVDGGESWLDRGCIIFSQYLDSARWLAVRLSALLTTETVGLYGGGDASGVFIAGVFERRTRDELREQVKLGALRLIVGTDAASEGLNLQRLGSLINLDLPWNPTRLEQRKGRIQRIGQLRDEVLIYNMRYRDSVEDRVHSLLSERLRSIRDMFGQLPDTLEDVWVNVALADVERAKQVIDAVPLAHPFEMRYDRVEPVDFESCSRVLDQHAQLELLRQGW